MQSRQETPPEGVVGWVLDSQREDVGKLLCWAHVQWKPDDILELFDMRNRSQDSAGGGISTLGHVQ